METTVQNETHDYSDAMTTIYGAFTPEVLTESWLLSPNPSGYPFSGDQIAKNKVL